MAIEKYPEEEERTKASEFIETVKNLKLNNCLDNSSDVKTFLSDLKHALRYGYNIDTGELNAPKWSYMNSFYFVGNIVTTIGK
jgi:hypothetical protein